MYEEQRTRIYNVLIIVLIFVGISIYSIYLSGQKLSLEIREEGLLISYKGEPDVLIAYDNMKDWYLEEEMDYGEFVSGIETGYCYYGVRKNQEYGEYYAYLTPGLDCVLIIETMEGIFAVSYQSDAETYSLYEAMDGMVSYYLNKVADGV